MLYLDYMLNDWNWTWSLLDMLGTAAFPQFSLNHSDNTNEELSSSSLVKCSNSSGEDDELSQCSSPDDIQSVECRLSERSACYVKLLLKNKLSNFFSLFILVSILIILFQFMQGFKQEKMYF